MPELPEVEVIVRGLRGWLEGERIVGIETRDRTLWERDTLPPGSLVGAQLLAVYRRGKFLVFSTEKGDLLLHLRMTGRVYKGKEEDPPPPRTRMGMRLSQGKQLWFSDLRRLGRACVVVSAPAYFERLGWGPEPLPWNRKAERALLEGASRSRRAIKVLLMDQRVLAGVGNIYADEALHRARIHPGAQAKALSRSALLRLYRALVEVLEEAIEENGTSFRDYRTAEGEEGGFQKALFVYQREGELCKSCARASIQRLLLGGRSAWFCPRCQRIPP